MTDITRPTLFDPAPSEPDPTGFLDSLSAPLPSPGPGNADKLQAYDLLRRGDIVTGFGEQSSTGVSTDFDDMVRTQAAAEAGNVLADNRPVEQKLPDLQKLAAKSAAPTDVHKEIAAYNAALSEEDREAVRHALLSDEEYSSQADQNILRGMERLAEFQRTQLSPDLKEGTLTSLFPHARLIAAAVKLSKGEFKAAGDELALAGPLMSSLLVAQQATTAKVKNTVKELGPLAVGIAAEIVAPFAATPLSIPLFTEQQRLVKGMADAMLGEQPFLDNLNTTEVITKVNTALQTATAEEAEAMLDRAFDFAKNSNVTSDLVRDEASKLLFANYSAASFPVKYASVMSWLNVAGSVAGATIKAGQTGVRAFRTTPGTAAETVGATRQGAERVLAAADAEGSEAALKAAGTTPAEVAGSHSVPQSASWRASEGKLQADIDTATLSHTELGADVLRLEKVANESRATAEAAEAAAEQAQTGVAAAQRQAGVNRAVAVAQEAESTASARFGAAVDAEKAAAEEVAALSAKAVPTAGVGARAEAVMASRARATAQGERLAAAQAKHARAQEALEQATKDYDDARRASLELTQAREAAGVATDAERQVAAKSGIAGKAQAAARKARRAAQDADIAYKGALLRLSESSGKLDSLKSDRDFARSMAERLDSAVDDIEKRLTSATPREATAKVSDPVAAAQADTALNRTATMPSGNGMNTSMATVLGRADGGFYKTAEEAAAAREIRFPGLSPEDVQVVKLANGEFGIKVGGKTFATLTEGLKGTIKSTSFWRRWFGRAASFKNNYVTMFNEALRRNLLTEKALQRLAKPIFNLNHEQSLALQRALEANEGVRWIDDAAVLRAEYNLDAAGVDAYNRVRQLSDMAWTLNNAATREHMLENGYSAWVRLHNGFEVAGRPLERAPSVAAVLDVETGRSLNPGSIAVEGTFVRFFEQPHIGGARWNYGFIRTGANVTRETPYAVTPYIPGHVGRGSKTRFLVKRFEDTVVDGRLVRADDAANTGRTVGYAQSEASAEKWAASQQALAPEGTKFKATYARETAGAEAEGGVYATHRSEVMPTDIDGGLGGVNIIDEIQRKMLSAAGALSTRKLADNMIREFETVYGSRFGTFGDFITGKVRVPATTADRRAFQEASMHVHEISQLLGISKPALGNAIGQGFDAAGRMLYGIAVDVGNGTGLARIVPQAARPSTKKVLLSIGDELTGLEQRSVSAAKTAAYLTLVAGKLSAFFVQTSNVATAVFMNGGFRHIVTGRLFNDAMILRASALMGRGPALGLAKTLGVAEKDANTLIDLFERSGFSQEVNSHVMTVGTFTDLERVAKSEGPLGRAVKSIAGVVSIPHKVGVKLDLDNSLSFAYARFRSMNKRLPTSQADMEEVWSNARTFSYNQNKLDSTILPSRGIMSLPFQFMSQAVKSAGRVLALEGPWTLAERMRLAVGNLAIAYGVGGTGLHGVYELQAWARDKGMNVPEEVWQLVREGYMGYAIDKTFSIFTGEDERLAVSERISPVNFIGPTLKGWTNFVRGALEGHNIGLSPDALGGAAVNMPKAFIELWNFAQAIGGNTDVPTGAKVAAILEEGASKFPGTNDILQASRAANAGNFIDKQGGVIAPASFESVIARALGFKTQRAYDVGVLQQRVYGPYAEAVGNNLTEENAYGAGRDAWNEWAGPLAVSLGDGKVSYPDAMHLFHTHLRYNKLTLKSNEFLAYFKGFSDAAGSDLTDDKLHKIINAVRASVASGKAPLNDNLIDNLNSGPFANDPDVQALIVELQNRLAYTDDLGDLNGKP